MEQVEKFELLDRPFKSAEPVPPSSERVDQEKLRREHRLETTGRILLTAKIVDVFGKESEPICDYLRCHHEFSVHGLTASKCKCKHPQNAAV
jgi:hypothetical protein